MKFKLGRRRPVAPAPCLKLRNYLLASVPAPPPSVNYAVGSQGAIESLKRMYLNDRYGDCVIAGGYHVEGVYTGNAGDAFLASDQQILADYSAISGYIPGNPFTDRGADIQTALHYWMAHGFASGNRLVGYLAVDPTNVQELMTAVYLFENLILGFELPDAYISPPPMGSGFTWDVAGEPNPQRGHLITGFGYDWVNGTVVSTWGMVGTMTWRAIAEYLPGEMGGELYTAIGPEMISKASQKAPNGFDWSQLVADFDSLGGSVLAPPQPNPGPAPPPGPPTPSIQQDIDAAFAEIEALLKHYPQLAGIEQLVETIQRIIDRLIPHQGEKMDQQKLQAAIAAGDATIVTQEVDKVFAQLEAAAAGRPLFVWVLKQANRLVDDWLAAHGL